MDMLYVDQPHFLLRLLTVKPARTERSFSPPGQRLTSAPTESHGGCKLV